jgi:fructose-1,6-bisphosphatase/inositol monophosphatase family enzyme
MIEASDTFIAPRFRSLTPDEVDEKSPGETVTIADRESEAFITTHLNAIAPGVPVVGEEAVSADPSLVKALATAPWCWLVDPLDGTSNFASGKPHWATEVALVRNGETVASWIYRHLDRRLYTAERGSGAWRNGDRLQAPTAAQPLANLRGAVLSRFLTEEERREMEPQVPRFGDLLPGFSCTGFEYPAIIEGEEDFALFQRLLPWDHAPGALLLTEAGGLALHPDGTPFRPDHSGRRGLLLGSSSAVWTMVRDTLYPNLASSAPHLNG